MEPESVHVLVLDFVSAVVPLVLLVIAPVIRFAVEVPSNWRVSTFVEAARLVTLARVMLAVVGLKMVVAPVVLLSVVAPKATTGDPPETFGPATAFNVNAPALSVPRVWVVPELAGVALSDSTVELAASVVLYAVMLVSVARSSVPPLSDSGAVEAPSAWVFPAIRVPEVTVVAPV